MKVHHASYQRAGPQGQAQFKATIGNGTGRLQIDGLGQVAQAMSRVFVPGAEIAIDYTDDLIAFRNIEDPPSIDYIAEDELDALHTKPYVSEGDAALEDLAISTETMTEVLGGMKHALGVEEGPSHVDIRSKLRKG